MALPGAETAAGGAVPPEKVSEKARRVKFLTCLSFPAIVWYYFSACEQENDMSILVIGGIYTDFIFDVPRLPLVNDVVAASKFKAAPGGKGLNIATTTRILQQCDVYI